MTRRLLTLIALALALLSAACAGNDAPDTSLSPTVVAADATVSLTEPPVVASPLPLATPTAQAVASPPPTATLPLLATRVGSDYVLLLPREDTVPAGWAINPPPDFQTRAPQPGDTYRFACRDLPARSIGIATVGYRHLDGLPSVTIEYVIYPAAADADTALADMRAAAESCGPFTIGAGTDATFAPLDFPALGDDRFAAALSTSGDETNDLLIHVVKVRQSHVVIGISHSARADDAPPDAALTQALVERAIQNLRDAPSPTGPRAN